MYIESDRNRIPTFQGLLIWPPIAKQTAEAQQNKTTLPHGQQSTDTEQRYDQVDISSQTTQKQHSSALESIQNQNITAP